MNEVNTGINEDTASELTASEEPALGAAANGGTDSDSEAPEAMRDNSEAETDPDYGEEESEVDYAALMADDLRTLKESFPELNGLGSIAELSGAMRYAALRDMGLDAVEAYMASCAPRRSRDSRAHLKSAVPKGASAPKGGMTKEELATARELFHGMTDAEIRSLYKRVSN